MMKTHCVPNLLYSKIPLTSTISVARACHFPSWCLKHLFLILFQTFHQIQPYNGILKQGSNFFYKCPETKYVLLCRPCSLECQGLNWHGSTKADTEIPSSFLMSMAVFQQNYLKQQVLGQIWPVSPSLWAIVLAHWSPPVLSPHFQSLFQPALLTGARDVFLMRTLFPSHFAIWKMYRSHSICF